MKYLRTNHKGFTLVEVAIVMVIIGLLIGGVLKGQAMIQNAKVKRVVKQADLYSTLNRHPATDAKPPKKALLQPREFSSSFHKPVGENFHK